MKNSKTETKLKKAQLGTKYMVDDEAEREALRQEASNAFNAYMRYKTVAEVLARWLMENISPYATSETLKLAEDTAHALHIALVWRNKSRLRHDRLLKRNAREFC